MRSGSWTLFATLGFLALAPAQAGARLPEPGARYFGSTSQGGLLIAQAARDGRHIRRSSAAATHPKPATGCPRGGSPTSQSATNPPAKPRAGVLVRHWRGAIRPPRDWACVMAACPTLRFWWRRPGGAAEPTMGSGRMRPSNYGR